MFFTGFFFYAKNPVIAVIRSIADTFIARVAANARISLLFERLLGYIYRN